MKNSPGAIGVPIVIPPGDFLKLNNDMEEFRNTAIAMMNMLATKTTEASLDKKNGTGNPDEPQIRNVKGTTLTTLMAISVTPLRALENRRMTLARKCCVT